MAEYDSVIPAGESGKLTARVHTNPSQNLVFRKGISVATDAPGAESIRLTIQLESVALIVVKPRFQVYVNTMVGQAKSEKVLVHRGDGKPLELSLAQQAPEGVEVSFATLKKADNSIRNAPGKPGDVWVTAAVSKSAKASTVSDKLIFKTNVPEQPELVIPLTLRVRSVIEPRPAQARLWVDRQGGASRISVIRLVHNKGDRFKVTELSSSRPEIFEVTMASPGEQNAHNIRITLSEDVDVDTLDVPLNAVLRIATDDETTPEITVPLVITERVRSQQRVLDRKSAVSPRMARPAPPGTLVRPTGTPGPR